MIYILYLKSASNKHIPLLNINPTNTLNSIDNFLNACTDGFSALTRP